MDQKEIEEIKKEQKKLADGQNRIMDALERQVEVDELLVEGQVYNANMWEKFLKIFFGFVGILFIVVILAFREQYGMVLSRIIGFVQSLSENWQILVVGGIWSLFLALLVLYLDRKYFMNSRDSKSSKNAKKSE